MLASLAPSSDFNLPVAPRERGHMANEFIAANVGRGRVADNFNAATVGRGRVAKVFTDPQAHVRPAPLPARGVKYTEVQKKLLKLSRVSVSSSLESREATPSGTSASSLPAKTSNPEAKEASAPASSFGASNSAAPGASAPARSSAGRTKTTLKVPRYKGVCGTAVCQIINPLSGHYCKGRVLIDSGANLSLIDRAVAKAIGLTGTPQVITINPLRTIRFFHSRPLSPIGRFRPMH